jgi:SAM-dependent methyltransferase
MDLKEADILGDGIRDHWYYRSKAKAISRLLSHANATNILDVGAGSGFFSKYLLAKSLATEAWCVDISYDSDSDDTQAGKSIHFRRSIDSVNADLVLLMDVLEHVDDDVALLIDYARKVPRGAYFLISVPAFHFLWSGHDVFLEHKRRYHLSQIETVAKRAGLTIKRGAYYFGAVFPIAAIIRLKERLFRTGMEKPHSQLKQHHLIINETLALFSQVELPLMPHNRLFGLTAFCLAQKQ